METEDILMNYDSPAGKLTIASDGTSIIGLWFEGQKYFARTLSPDAAAAASPAPVLVQAKEWLDRYFKGERPSFSLSLRPRGTDFQKAVWDVLLSIPYGEVITYGDIAKAIAAKTGRETMSAQAVGGAVGHNPISILIPCHRVVGANGSLTGYAGGIDKKIKLLTLEGVDVKRFSVPTRRTAL